MKHNFPYEFQWHVKGRIVGGKGDDSSIESGAHELNDQNLTSTSMSTKSDNVSPIKELSDEEIEQMKKQLSKQLTPLQTDEFGRILNKFKKGTTTKDHVEGIVSTNRFKNTYKFVSKFTTFSIATFSAGIISVRSGYQSKCN